jgi:hypothetical protein
MADAGLMGGFTQFGSMMIWLKYGAYGLIFLIIVLALVALALFFIVQATNTKVYEFNLVTRRIRVYDSRYKKNSHGMKQLWVGKIKKFLPMVQQEDIYIKGRQDTVLLIKDQNGLYHTARLPDYDELRDIYNKLYGINLDDVKEEEAGEEPDLIQSDNKVAKFINRVKGKLIPKKAVTYQQKLKSVYLMPNPHEDLDWLAAQCTEADREFNVDVWWKSPVVAYIGVGFVCFLMIVVSLIIEKKF